MLILVTKVQTIQCNLQHVERHQDNRISILPSFQFCCESKTALKNNIKEKDNRRKFTIVLLFYVPQNW